MSPVEKRTAGRVAEAPRFAKPKPSRRIGDDRPAYYTVQRGDTLYAIALDFGFGYRDLAAWNDLADPGVILPGRQLRLAPPPAKDEMPETRGFKATGGVTAEPLGAPGNERPAGGAAPTRENGAALPQTAPGKATPEILTEPQAKTLRYSDQALAQLGGPAKPTAPAPAPVPAARTETPPSSAPRAEPKPETAVVSSSSKPSVPPAAPAPDATRDADDKIDWLWPARGELLYRFGESGKLKGIGVGGKVGQPIVAAGGGKVVYAGSGLRGYGKLVIVKHNETFLSVYAHNSALTVKEGDPVRRGQKIAEMGDTDAARVALHFEIRRFGKPLDPLSQLPRLPEPPG